MSEEEIGNFLKVLVAEDDPDDCLLIRRAVASSGSPYEMFFVQDGVQLMDFLYRRGSYTTNDEPPKPDLILLDLNMPRKDGREVLMEISENTELQQIPVVVFSTSNATCDRNLALKSGARQFITKPDTFRELEAIIASLAHLARKETDWKVSEEKSLSDRDQ